MLRSPLANLDTVVPRPGLVAVVGVLFGSTGFDSFRESTAWLTLEQSLSASRVGPDTLALIGFSVGVALILTVATMATGVSGSTPLTWSESWRRMTAPSGCCLGATS